MIINADDEAALAHYGVLRKSGRYPWGSGATQTERNRTFLGMVDNLEKSGMSQTQVASSLGITTTELRAAKSNAKAMEKAAKVAQAQGLADKGLSNIAIGKEMGINESSVRALLAPGALDTKKVTDSTSDALRNAVGEKKYVDVGSGVHLNMGISSTQLNNAVKKLEDEGYRVHNLKIEQLGTGQMTNYKVLTPPGTEWAEVMRNKTQIQPVLGKYSNDHGRSFVSVKPPISVDAKRVGVRYAEQGGKDADGMIYVRRGVKDLSLGGSSYAQVRILVNGTHYLKGVAIYRDDLPENVDLVFNTNKSSTGNKLDAMKPIKEDQDNPFGATIRQIQDQHGKVTSALNLVNEEGKWGDWSSTLSTQFLSKQSSKLVSQQLDKTRKKNEQEFARIMATPNPAVRQRLLQGFADSMDSAAVHMKAQAIKGQGSHVIIPVSTLKENEVYAPNYKNGDIVALVRYPHAGTFEIPTLRVNNNHPDAKKQLGQAVDAIGIHPKVAERMSGADFDGDSVLVIPNNDKKIISSPALKGLEGFDGQRLYKLPPGSPKMSKRTEGMEMGKISNLISDMNLRKASQDELARAVRHSMVVIDARKHGLDYRRSAQDNGIRALEEKYQNDGKKIGGASTLISRAKSEERVLERKLARKSEGGPIDPITGAKRYVQTGASYTDANGKVVPRSTKSTKLAEATDAHKLSSGTVVEGLYADYSNSTKSLANQARLELLKTPNIKYSPQAKKTYAKEVASLNQKYNEALAKSPSERHAQLVATAIYKQKLAANPDLDKEEKKRLKFQALTEARLRTGVKKTNIDITPSEWAAIQAGALTHNRVSDILAKADLEQIKKLAMPKAPAEHTPAQINRAQTLLKKYTIADVAAAMGMSVGEVRAMLKEAE